VNLKYEKPKNDDKGWVDVAPGGQVFFKGVTQRKAFIAGGFGLVRMDEDEALKKLSELKPIDAKNALDPRVITTFPEGKK
jgi:hypothetical protein